MSSVHLSVGVIEHQWRGNDIRVRTRSVNQRDIANGDHGDFTWETDDGSRQVWFWQPWKRAAIVAFLCCAHTRGTCSSRSMRRSNRLEQVWDRSERSKKFLLTQTGALIRIRMLTILCQFVALLSEIRSPSMNRPGASHVVSLPTMIGVVIVPRFLVRPQLLTRVLPSLIG